jgi:SOS response regulatory protein OraA/RecX
MKSSAIYRFNKDFMKIKNIRFISGMVAILFSLSIATTQFSILNAYAAEPQSAQSIEETQSEEESSSKTLADIWKDAKTKLAQLSPAKRLALRIAVAGGSMLLVSVLTNGQSGSTNTSSSSATPSPSISPTPVETETPTPTQTPQATKEPEVIITPVPTDSTIISGTMTDTQESALARAKLYLQQGYFSERGLREKLIQDGYSAANAAFAVNRCYVDWSTQAVNAAKSYVKNRAISESALLKLLLSDGFTNEQSKNAVKKCGADWDEEAAQAAKELASAGSYSYASLVIKLQSEEYGFTEEQAEYGVKHCGVSLDK